MLKGLSTRTTIYYLKTCHKRCTLVICPFSKKCFPRVSCSDGKAGTFILAKTEYLVGELEPKFGQDSPKTNIKDKKVETTVHNWAIKVSRMLSLGYLRIQKIFCATSWEI